VKQSQGFTLVELLVAMSLLSMIIYLASSAFGLFSQRWDGRLGQFEKTMHSARSKMLVQEILTNLVPYVAYENSGKAVIFFEGNRNGFVGVSSQSIYKYDNYAVVRLSVRQNPELYDVIYEEWPMDRDHLVSVDQTISFSEPLILFSAVSSPLFEYYGWPQFTARIQNETKFIPPKWSSNYNAVDSLFMPVKVKLTFTTAKGPYQLFSHLPDQRKGLLSRYQNRISFSNQNTGLLGSE